MPIVETSSRRSLEELFSLEHKNNKRKDNTDMRTSKYYVRDDCSVSKNEMIQTRAHLKVTMCAMSVVSLKTKFVNQLKKSGKPPFNQDGFGTLVSY